MKRIIVIPLLIGITLVAAILSAQAPVFEVASIRPASPPTPETMRSGQFHRGTKIDAEHLDFGFVSLANLLPYAFRVKQYQVVVPDWTRDSMWNILANLPAGATESQVPEMMRALLADRFKMTVHREKREQPVYQLTVAPGGAKVELSTGGDFKIWDGSFPGFNFGGGLLGGGATISGRILDQPNCGQRWEFIPLPMSAFADALTKFLDKPVVDETGLKGDYKVVLDIDAETMVAMNQNMMRSNGLPPPGGGRGGGGGGRGGPDGGVGPGDAGGRLPPSPAQGLAQCVEAVGPDGSIGKLLQAVQKMGLKLQQGRAAIETVVVDRLEKTPTEN